jgi:hypothetical protein
MCDCSIKVQKTDAQKVQDKSGFSHQMSNKQSNAKKKREMAVRMKRKVQRGNVPFNLKSRLLAPTEREYVPKARIHV